MLPYFTSLEHPQQNIVTRVAHILYKANRELNGITNWSYIRTDSPLDNLEYQASILETIQADLHDAEGCIARIGDEDTRSALTMWHSLVYRSFFEMWEAYSKVAGGSAD